MEGGKGVMRFNYWHFGRQSSNTAQKVEVPVGNTGMPVHTAASEAGSRRRASTLDVQEQMAGLLATERLKTHAEVYDPFEVWNKAREEILSRFRRVQHRPLTALGHIA